MMRTWRLAVRRPVRQVVLSTVSVSWSNLSDWCRFSLFLFVIHKSSQLNGCCQEFLNFLTCEGSSAFRATLPIYVWCRQRKSRWRRACDLGASPLVSGGLSAIAAWSASNELSGERISWVILTWIRAQLRAVGWNLRTWLEKIRVFLFVCFFYCLAPHNRLTSSRE